MPFEPKPVSPWASRQQIVLVLAVLAAGLLMFSWWPFGLSVWLVALILFDAWPPPERYEMMSKASVHAEGIKHARKMLWTHRGWLPGVPVGCEEQKECRSFSPVSFASMVGWWFAVLAVGIELGAAYYLATPGVPALYTEWGVDTASRAYYLPLTVPVTFLVVMPVARVLAAARQQARYAEETGAEEYGMPNAATAEPTLFSWMRASLVTWYAAAAGVATGLGAAAAATSNMPADYIGWPATIVLLVCVNTLITFGMPMLKDAKFQHQEWFDPKYEERQWRLRWVGTKGLGFTEQNAPVVMSVHKIPEPPADPTHEIVVFRLKGGTKFEHVATSKAHKLIASAMISDRVLIEHINGPGPDVSLNTYAFMVTYQLYGVDIGSKPHMDPSLDMLTWQFAVRHKVVTAFLDCKLSTPVMIGRPRELSQEGHRNPLLDTHWYLTEGDTFLKVSNMTEQLREYIGCDWLRVYQVPGTTHVGIAFGARPKDTELRMPRQTQKLIHRIEWEYLMRNAGMLGKDGNPPALESSSPAPLNLTEMVFRYPPGVNYKKVKMGLDSLRAQTEHQYLEFEHHKDSGRFVLLVGEEDPLSRVYPFSEHRKEVLVNPKRGFPKINWTVGVRANGQYAEYEWDAEQPHLLIAGASGSGKSAIINSMLCQIMHNSHPDDVCFWLADPKNEFVAYQNSAHVRRLVDLTSVEGSQYAACAALLQEAVAEMEHRYETFARHPLAPQKLSEAREMAQADPEKSGHLNFPYLFLMIEECSDYFAPPADKLDKLPHGMILSLISSLARKSRAAGIYIMAATQYPVKQNIPTTLKNQCRSIGLFTQNDVASHLIINESGLEDIKDRGRGMVSDGKQYVGFRGLFMERSEEAGNRIDERADILNSLPKSQVWPKLPEGVKPSRLVRVQGAGELPGCEVARPVPAEGVVLSNGSNNGEADDFVDTKMLSRPAPWSAALTPSLPPRPQEHDLVGSAAEQDLQKLASEFVP